MATFVNEDTFTWGILAKDFLALNDRNCMLYGCKISNRSDMAWADGFANGTKAYLLITRKEG
jgi:hypothetical protein